MKFRISHRNRLSGIFMLLTACFSSFAQSELEKEYFILQILSAYEEEENTEALFDQLMQFYQNPLDLNKAGHKEFENLRILNSIEIQAILNYRDQYGDFTSFYELQAIQGIDSDKLKKLRPFVSVNSGSNLNQPLGSRLLNPDKHYAMYRYQRDLEEARGFSSEEGEKYFLGSADKHLFRYRYQKYNDYSLGFCLEKDQGEQFTWDPSTNYYGFDYISAHLYKERIRSFEKIIIGDYQLQFGQGLTFSAGFRTGKGSETILSTKQINTGIRPYSSTMENNFQRGAAFTYRIGSFSLSPYFSTLLIDGNPTNKEDSLIANLELSGFDYSGLHNTETSLLKRKNTREYIYGLNAQWNNDLTEIGFNLAAQNFSNTLQGDNTFRNKYEFNGKSNRNGSLYYSLNILNVNIFGETASSSSGGLANIHGIIAALNRFTDLSLVYRNYNKKYSGIRSASFSENNEINNEKGLYLGISQKLKRSIQISGYYDLFSNPWISYSSNVPSYGNEYLLRFEKRIKKETIISLQHRQETKLITANEKVIPESQERIRIDQFFQLDHIINEFISVRTRINWRTSKLEEVYRGFALSQDLRFNWKGLRIDFRTAIFDTDNYESRTYILERDVLYSLSAPAYFGKGIRNYITIKLKATKNLSLWLRWARTFRVDQNYFGSSQNLIDGNDKNQIKFQMILNL